MALPRGQVDRFGKPIPANQSVKVFINADGTVPQQRETIRLDANIVASDDQDTQATLLTLGATPSGAISSLTTDVVASGPGVAIATIQTGVVTNAKLATMAANTIKGNATGSTAAPTDQVMSGVTAGRLGIETLIDRQVVSSVNSVTSLSWTAGAYRRIRLKFDGHTNSTNFLSVRPNGISTSSYGYGIIAGFTGGSVGYFQGARNSATHMPLGLLGGDVDIDAEFSMNPLIIAGKVSRSGRATLGCEGATSGVSYTNPIAFSQWNDVTTAMTSITLLNSGVDTMTGEFELWGLLA